MGRGCKATNFRWALSRSLLDSGEGENTLIDLSRAKTGASGARGGLLPIISRSAWRPGSVQRVGLLAAIREWGVVSSR